MSYRRVQKIKKGGELLHTVSVTRYGPQLATGKSRTFRPKIAIFPPVSGIFKYNPGQTNNKFITSQ